MSFPDWRVVWGFETMDLAHLLDEQSRGRPPASTEQEAQEAPSQVGTPEDESAAPLPDPPAPAAEPTSENDQAVGAANEAVWSVIYFAQPTSASRELWDKLIPPLQEEHDEYADQPLMGESAPAEPSFELTYTPDAHQSAEETVPHMVSPEEVPDSVASGEMFSPQTEMEMATADDVSPNFGASSYLTEMQPTCNVSDSHRSDRWHRMYARLGRPLCMHEAALEYTYHDPGTSVQDELCCLCKRANSRKTSKARAPPTDNRLVRCCQCEVFAQLGCFVAA